jgi:hypothetical protein
MPFIPAHTLELGGEGGVSNLDRDNAVLDVLVICLRRGAYTRPLFGST